MSRAVRAPRVQLERQPELEQVLAGTRIAPNFILDAENGAQLSNWTYYASPNAASMEFLDEDLVDDPAVFPDEDVREGLHFLESTGEAEILNTDLFTRAQG